MLSFMPSQSASERVRLSPCHLACRRPWELSSGCLWGFTAAQVWNDSGNASAAVDREASALRSVVLLAASFPCESENHLRALVASYIAEAKAQEWPLMARRAITLTIVPHALFEALQFTLSL